MTSPTLSIKFFLLSPTIRFSPRSLIWVLHYGAAAFCSGTLTVTARGWQISVAVLVTIMHLCLVGFPVASSRLCKGWGRGVPDATLPHGVTRHHIAQLGARTLVSGFQRPQRLGHMPAGCKELQTSKHLSHLSVDQVVFFLASREV